MRQKLEALDFDFAYTGGHYPEEYFIQNGIQKLTGKELQKAIVNRTVFGDYPMGYKFIANIHKNGTVEGVNHVGTQDSGNWAIDMKAHTLALTWDNGWINTITHAYEINGNIELYDRDTGKWRTTFKRRKNLIKE